MTIGERMRALRMEKGLSQVQVADTLGITKQLLYKYETNIVTNIPLNIIDSFSKMMGISPSIVMGWKTEDGIEEEQLETEFLDELRTNPEMKILFSTLKGATKEDYEKAINLIKIALNK